MNNLILLLMFLLSVFVIAIVIMFAVALGIIIAKEYLKKMEKKNE